MARETVITCDICSKTGASTVKFSASGKTYEVDLCAKDTTAFEKALAPYTMREVKAPAGILRKTEKFGANAATIRDWAMANGWDISAKGRIPSDVREAYEAAN